MSSFLFGFALVLLVSIGARDQLLVSRLAGRTGPGVLLAGSLAAILTAFVMAWGGNYIADLLFPAAKHMLVAFALGAAAIELAWPSKDTSPKEPTHSVVAAFIVILARQIGDAARFIVFALAAATALPALVAAGGALGGIVALAMGWIMGAELEAVLPLRIIRRVLAAAMLVAALVIGLGARGIL